MFSSWTSSKIEFNEGSLWEGETKHKGIIQEAKFISLMTSL